MPDFSPEERREIEGTLDLIFGENLRLEFDYFSNGAIYLRPVPEFIAPSGEKIGLVLGLDSEWEGSFESRDLPIELNAFLLGGVDSSGVFLTFELSSGKAVTIEGPEIPEIMGA